MVKKRKTCRRKGRSRALRTALIVLAVLAVSGAALCVLLRFASYDEGFDNSAYRADAFAGQKVLVLAPHEDDDVAMAGATIRLYVDGGAEVYVAFLSNGDFGSDPDLRVREAIRGLAALGVDRSHIILLGYGDSWDYRTYKHIYHAPSDAVVSSASGRTETFGAAGLTDLHTQIYGEPAAYTRANIISDLRKLLIVQRPDTVFCVDLDSHTDHCGLSWMFEEALGELLKDHADYRPKVYKGYAYSVAWFGEKDFYGDNMTSSLPPDATVVNDPRFPLDMPCYSWEERVRFPAPREALSYTLRSNVVWRALAAHASQDARFRAANIINGDTVFFERRTDSLLYLPGTALTATSGAVDGLNDFKLVDTYNILDWPIAFDAGVWRPAADDAKRCVTVTFPHRVDVASVSLYDDYEPESNILSGTLTFSDGSTVAVDALHPDGRETRVTFPTKRGVTSFTFTLNEAEGEAGLTELCAYAPEPAETAAFIKLTNAETGDFLYRATMHAGERFRLGVYAYPNDGDAAYTVSVTGGNGDVTVENGVLTVRENARAGSCTVTAVLDADQTVFDTVEIVIPTVWETAYHRLLEYAERGLDRVEYKLHHLKA